MAELLVGFLITIISVVVGWALAKTKEDVSNTKTSPSGTSPGPYEEDD